MHFLFVLVCLCAPKSHTFGSTTTTEDLNVELKQLTRRTGVTLFPQEPIAFLLLPCCPPQKAHQILLCLQCRVAVALPSREAHGRTRTDRPQIRSSRSRIRWRTRTTPPPAVVKPVPDSHRAPVCSHHPLAASPRTASRP